MTTPLLLFILLSGAAEHPGDSVAASVSQPSIDVWYGDRQRFGHRGSPQMWVNILGRVTGENGLRLRYQLNDGDEKPLSLGPNGTRLAAKGDFNVEIATAALKLGDNVITLVAKGVSGAESSRTVTVNWTARAGPQLPFHIDWSTASSIFDVAQVVDGRWELVDGGVRCVEPYYDRVLAFGSQSWKDYEVHTSVIFHARRLPGKQDGGRGVIHAAIATRWPGHDEDDVQPHVKWHPLGATSEFMLTDWPDNCRWRILGGPDRHRHAYQRVGRTIQFGKRYAMKHRVQTLANGSTEYRVKLWAAGHQEPDQWDLLGTERPDDVTHGGALLIAHYTEVTFGNVKAVPLDGQSERR